MLLTLLPQLDRREPTQTVDSWGLTLLMGRALDPFRYRNPDAVLVPFRARVARVDPHGGIRMHVHLVKRSAETLLADIDCSAIMGPGETIYGTPTVTADATAGAALTFTGVRVNSVPTTYPDRRQVPAGKVIQVLIGGGSIPAGLTQLEYVVRARFSTTNAGELREATVRLLVIDAP